MIRRGMATWRRGAMVRASRVVMRSRSHSQAAVASSSMGWATVVMRGEMTSPPRHVVDPGQRHVARTGKAEILDRLERAERHQVGGRDDGGRPVGLGQEPRRLFVGALAGKIGNRFKRRIELEPGAGHGLAVTVEAQLTGRQRQPAADIADAGMTEPDQVFGEHHRRQHIVGFDQIELRAADVLVDQHHRYVVVSQETGELGARIERRHQYAGHPVATQLVERGGLARHVERGLSDDQHVVGRFHHLGDRAQKAAEERVGHVAEHKADHARVPALEALGQRIGRIADLFDGLHDLAPRFLADRSGAVESEGNRRDRDAGPARHITYRCHPCPFPPFPQTG